MSEADDQGLFRRLREAFPADRGEVAIEVPGPKPSSWTWAAIESWTARMARLLESLDLPPASRIVAQVEKSVEGLLLYLAVLRAGHVFVPLNPAYKAEEVEYFLLDAEPALVVCPGHSEGWVRDLGRGRFHVLTLDADGSGSLIGRASGQEGTQEPVPRSMDELAAIIYTSGTTGRSKGAMLSHGNLISNALTLREHWAWTPQDVLIHALPIFHVHGLFVAAQGALLAGARMIWFDRFDPTAVLEAMPRATLFMGVPTMYVRLLALPGLTREASANLRLFVSGSAPLLLETFDGWRDRLGNTILERYGMSETLMLTSNPYLPEEGARKGGTVGLPLPGVSLRVVGEGGAACATGDPGGIEVRGPNVFGGYWRRPEKKGEDFTPDGWFRTGDVGKLDPDGYVTIVGRSKDLIITGGFNVYPAEVEGYLNETGAVAESAAFGVPHPDFGEAVVAVVVAKSGALLDSSTLIEGLKARIANFKVPKRIFQIDELPRNAMGKVQKNLLRERYSKLFVT